MNTDVDIAAHLLDQKSMVNKTSLVSLIFFTNTRG